MTSGTSARAGQAFAELHLDPDDVVDVQLPAYRGVGEREPEDWSRPDWPRRLVSWMFRQARHAPVVDLGMPTFAHVAGPHSAADDT
jgi:hypothetical protein